MSNFPVIELSNEFEHCVCNNTYQACVCYNVHTVKPHLSRPPLIRIIHLYMLYMIIYRESESYIRIFSYPDSRLGTGGVRISEGSLYSLHIPVLSADCPICPAQEVKVNEVIPSALVTVVVIKGLPQTVCSSQSRSNIFMILISTDNVFITIYIKHIYYTDFSLI